MSVSVGVARIFQSRPSVCLTVCLYVRSIHVTQNDRDTVTRNH